VVHTTGLLELSILLRNVKSSTHTAADQPVPSPLVLFAGSLFRCQNKLSTQAPCFLSKQAARCKHFVLNSEQALAEGPPGRTVTRCRRGTERRGPSIPGRRHEIFIEIRSQLRHISPLLLCRFSVMPLAIHCHLLYKV
jgi:hypothetical protein